MEKIKKGVKVRYNLSRKNFRRQQQTSLLLPFNYLFTPLLLPFQITIDISFLTTYLLTI